MVKRNDVREREKKGRNKKKKRRRVTGGKNGVLEKGAKPTVFFVAWGREYSPSVPKTSRTSLPFFLSLHPYPVPSHLQSKKKTLLLLLLLLLSFLSPSFLPFSRATPTTTNRGLLPHFFPSPLQLLRFFFPRFLASLLPSLRLPVATITAQLPLPWQG